MTVYIIRAESTGKVKIGRSKNPDQRLACLQMASPDHLTIVRLIEGAGRFEETWLHQRFGQLRRHGEWFDFDEEMLSVTPPAAPTKAQPVVVAMPGVRALLLRQIDLYLLRTGMSKRQFGIVVANDCKFVSRLRNGKNMTLRLMEAAEAYMRSVEMHVPQPRGQAAASSARASAAFSNSDPAARPQVFMGAPS